MANALKQAKKHYGISTSSTKEEDLIPTKNILLEDVPSSYEKAEIRQKLEEALRVESMWEHGISPTKVVDTEKIAPNGKPYRAIHEFSYEAQKRIAQGIRNLKALYATIRVSMQANETLADSVAEPEVVIKKNVMNLVWKVDTDKILVCQIRKYGQERSFKMFQHYGQKWIELNSYNGVEFPLHEVSKGKFLGLDGKEHWEFELLPDMKTFVACVTVDFYYQQFVDFYNGLYEDIKKEAIESEYEEKTAEYITTISESNVWHDGFTESFQKDRPVLDFWEQELEDHNGSMVDPKYSAMITNKILEYMDPNNVGYATAPMRIYNGKIWNPSKKEWLPLHKDVEESHKWLQGYYNRKKRKLVQGFVSNPSLTREDRQLLIEFANRTKEVLDKEKEAEVAKMLNSNEMYNAEYLLQLLE